MYMFCMTAISGISMQVSRVSSQDRLIITANMRQVFTVLRTRELALRATVRPILSTSQCRREERPPGGWREEVSLLQEDQTPTELMNVPFYILYVLYSFIFQEENVIPCLHLNIKANSWCVIVCSLTMAIKKVLILIQILNT